MNKVINILLNKKVNYRKQIARQHLCHQKCWPLQGAWSTITSHLVWSPCKFGGCFSRYECHCRADGLVLIVPSWRTVQTLYVLYAHTLGTSMTLNTQKPSQWYFLLQTATELLLMNSLYLWFGWSPIKFVNQITYLGHIVTDSLSDDDDRLWEVKHSLFVLIH